MAARKKSLASLRAGTQADRERVEADKAAVRAVAWSRQLRLRLSVQSLT